MSAVTDNTGEVWPLLGLPFNPCRMQDAVTLIHQAIDSRQDLFISTPNLNFAMAALDDLVFRQSVLNSGLSIADGMPLVWTARLLSIPIRERVTGSGLLEALIHDRSRADKPVRIFFFGGAEGVAKQACENISREGLGVVGAGHYCPGFGSVEDMSHPDIINTINESGAEFVIVALGAKKGQAWIEHNRKKLNAPVISHLGAAVNFAAGTQKRAPVLFQRTGLEWLWRIKEEPSLWRRYFHDGRKFVWLLFARILPYAIKEWLQSRKHRHDFTAELRKEDNCDIVVLSGDLATSDLHILEQVIEPLQQAKDAITVFDFEKVTYVSPAFIGLLMSMKGVNAARPARFELRNVSVKIRKIFRLNCAEYLLDDPSGL